MAIIFEQQHNTFLLQAGNASYAMQVSPEGYLYHLYFGKQIQDTALDFLAEGSGGQSFSAHTPEHSRSLDIMLQECPINGVGDYRVPAVSVKSANGAQAVCLKYENHEVLAGQKPPLPAMPATYLNGNEADTLVISMQDKLIGLRVKLYYCVFTHLNVITRWAVAENVGGETLQIESLQSACVEFPHMDYDMLHFQGAWGREHQLERRPLFHGTQSVQSRRGSSSHHLPPFAILCDKNADESLGNTYGFSIIYSGNFRIEVEANQMHTTRVVTGINPDNFAWQLLPGATFTTPEVVLSYSDEGLGGISNTMHKLYRHNLIRGQWKEKPCPILINSWEAAFFDFNADKLVNFARAAKKADVELLVMDDGWFGKRYDDTTSLGDWNVNEEKLGCTLQELVQRVNDEGMEFGIWYEPEMISPESELYKAHPDWAIHIPGRGRSLGRKQCVINLTLPEVRDYLFDQISATLASANIVYLKWDFNRNLTEVYSAIFPAEQQGEVVHRFVLGVYELMDRLVTAFPHILFESCSGGGGRFDPGMLYYMPQTWASDNTDPVDRLRIQYGASFCYPIRSIGAHVSKIPERGRVTSLQYRADVAMMGTFGYELDPTKLPEEDIVTMKEINAQFKQWQPLINTGDFYRLNSPFEGEVAAWMFVAPDQSEALVQCFTVLAPPNSWDVRVYPRGLDPKTLYELDCATQLHGSTIMNAGLRLQHFGGDFNSRNVHLKRVS